METMYKTAPPIEETELEFWRRKAQDRATFIAEQEATILKLRGLFDDIRDICEEEIGEPLR